MSSRKSQLEKFYERQNKARKDEEVVKEAEVKNSTIEKRAGKVVNQYGMSTEDIFMIIARESVGPFVKMWNNSMENVIRETIKNEVKNVVKEVVQEEMAAAIRGFMKGLMPDPEEIAKDFLAQFNPEPKQEEAEEEIDESIPIEIITDDEESDEIESYNDDDRMRKAILTAYHESVDVYKVKEFKKLSPQHNTIYQRFVKKNQGIAGGWRGYVDYVLENYPH